MSPVGPEVSTGRARNRTSMTNVLRVRVRVYDELAVNNGTSQWVQRVFVVRKEEPLEVAVDVVAIDLRANLASFSATNDIESKEKAYEKYVLLFRL